MATDTDGNDSQSLFVGRVAELARLRRCSELARSGKPAAVLLLGEAGVGKTFLVRHWLASREMSGFIVLHARCHPDESDYPYGVVEQLASSAPGEMTEILKELHSVPAGTPVFHTGLQALRMFDRLQDFGAVAVSIDDVQWADAESLRSLAFALRRMEADQLIAVMTIRSSEGQGAHLNPEAEALISSIEVNGHVERIHLPGLTVREIDELVQHIRPRGTTVGVARQLAEFTGGNALYVRTLLSAKPTFEEGVDFPSAHSLGGALRRQLSTLSGSSRSLVEATAVLGSQASLALVASVAGVPDPIAALQPALASGFLKSTASGPDELISFRHALQRDAALSSMDPSRLRAMHAAAAERLPAPDKWAHLVASTVTFDHELSAQLEAAAQEKIDAGDSSQAATLLLYAARIADSRAAEERLLLSAAVQLVSIDQFSRLEDILPRIREYGPSPVRSLVLGAVAISMGHMDHAETELKAALEGSQRGSEFEWVAPFAATWLCIRYSFAGDAEGTMEASRRVLSSSAGLSPALAARAKARLVQGRSFIDGPRAGLHEFALVADIPAVPRTSLDAYLMMIRGFSLCWAGEMTDAVGDLGVSLPKVREAAGTDLEFGYIHLSKAQFHLGQWNEAAANADKALAIAAAEGKPWTWAVAYATAVAVPAARGLSTAREYLQAARRWSDQFAPAFSQAAVAAATAWMARAENDPATMEAVLSPFLGQVGMARALEGSWLPLFVEAALRDGTRTTEVPALARLAELAAEYPYLRIPAARLSGVARLARRDWAGAEELWRRAIDAAAHPDDSPFERALLHQAYGDLQLLLDHRSQAATWLRRAADTLDSLGARPYLERCLQRLEVAGDDLRAARHLSVLGGLTTREAEIASLIGRGLTNNEISSELFISAKTVEYHLGNIYRRLRLSGRRALRDAVQRDRSIEPAD